MTDTIDAHPAVAETTDTPHPPVGPAAPTRMATPAGTKRDIIPEWVRDPITRHAAVTWTRQYIVHWFLFHLARIPLYFGRSLLRAPVGAYRVIYTVCSWACDAGGAEDRATLMNSVQSDGRGHTQWQSATIRHQNTVHLRTALTAVAAMAAILGGHAAWSNLSATGQTMAAVLAAVLSALLLGVAGRKADRPLTDAAATSANIPPLSAELIVRALAAAVPKVNQALTKDPKAVTFVAPITRSGKGWRADLDLPLGVTASEIIERRESLASGLRRPESCVWPEVDGSEHTHAARLILYVSDTPLASANKVEWPLAKKGRTNVFDPIPIGVDQRGNPVSVVLMYASGLIGAIPRMGKTFLLRLLTLGAGLDERVELHLYNLKGGADFEPLRHIAHTYRAGDDTEDIEAAAHDLRAVKAEMRARYAKLKALGPDVCPEAKVTDDLASDKALNLHPIFIAVDECQLMFEHPNHGKELEALATDLVKRGPAVGIMVWFATQRPDAKAIPPGLRDNAILRFCLKVIGHQANDMVLGTGAYKAGYQATAFGRHDRGIALMAGETDDPRIVRAAYVDNAQAEDIAKRARAVRLSAGRLTGLAAGQDPAPDDSTASIINHLLDVWPAGQDKVHGETLAGLLAARFPDAYNGWKAEQVTSACTPHGIRSMQVKRDGVNRKGIAMADVLEVAADRLDPGDIA